MKIAFFDVDQTLIIEKSVFMFLKFYMIKKKLKGYSYDEIVNIIKNKESQGVSREELNNLYNIFWGYSKYQIKKG